MTGVGVDGGQLPRLVRRVRADALRVGDVVADYGKLTHCEVIDGRSVLVRNTGLFDVWPTSAVVAVVVNAEPVVSAGDRRFAKAMQMLADDDHMELVAEYWLSELAELCRPGDGWLVIEGASARLITDRDVVAAVVTARSSADVVKVLYVEAGAE